MMSWLEWSYESKSQVLKVFQPWCTSPFISCCCNFLILVQHPSISHLSCYIPYEVLLSSYHGHTPFSGVCHVQHKAVVPCLCCLIVVSVTPNCCFCSHLSFIMLPITVVQWVLFLLRVAIVSLLLHLIVIQTSSVICAYMGTNRVIPMCGQYSIDRNCNVLPLSLDDLLNHTTLM